MDPSARLFLCARCRSQVVLCSHCDRGNRYCGRPCRRLARAAAQRASACRYQGSRRGRLAHAERSRRWRQRHRARCDDALPQENVTHQGCPAGPLAAPLAVWTASTPSTPKPADAVAATLAATALTAAATNLPTPWLCQRCAKPLAAWVRQGFLRHSPHAARPRWRRDHSP